MDVEILQADARRIPLADGCVQCVVTSPPYWGLRKYAGAQDLVWPNGTHTQGIVRCNRGDHEWGNQIEVNATNHTGTARWNHTRNGRDEEQPTEKRVAWLRTAVAQGCVCILCGAWRGSFGLEPSIEMYVQHTVEILREIRRVLRRDGVVFWNIGDSYAGGGNYRGTNEATLTEKQRSNRGAHGELAIGRTGQLPPTLAACKTFRPGSGRADGIVDERGQRNRDGCPASPGLKAKDLCLIPARVAIAAQADGWWIRSLIIWAKPNPMPESVTDRPTDAYEHIIMLTKSERYFWDADAVREPQAEGTFGRYGKNPIIPPKQKWSENSERGGQSNTNMQEHIEERDGAMVAILPNGRNLRNVWTFATQPYKGAHFATFPEEIPRRCILAATSERGACTECGTPWQRVLEKKPATMNIRVRDAKRGVATAEEGYAASQTEIHNYGKEEMGESRTIGWKPMCDCTALTKPCLVLDPFGGSGTTARVAVELNRRAISMDLAYHDHAEKRTRNVQRQLVASSCADSRKVADSPPAKTT